MFSGCQDLGSVSSHPSVLPRTSLSPFLWETEIEKGIRRKSIDRWAYTSRLHYVCVFLFFFSFLFRIIRLRFGTDIWPLPSFLLLCPLSLQAFVSPQAFKPVEGRESESFRPDPRSRLGNSFERCGGKSMPRFRFSTYNSLAKYRIKILLCMFSVLAWINIYIGCLYSRKITMSAFFLDIFFWRDRPERGSSNAPGERRVADAPEIVSKMGRIGILEERWRCHCFKWVSCSCLR